MDDILLVYAESDAWDSERFISDFQKSTCYQEPLKLEAGKDGIFLETKFHIDDNNLIYKLKNDNGTGEIKVWRYQHFRANSPFLQKRATLTACLRKVQSMSSGPSQLVEGALEKMAEFRRLRYPKSVLQKACAYLAASTGDDTWITVRSALR